MSQEQARKIITDLETFYDSNCDEYIEERNKEIDKELDEVLKNSGGLA